MTTLTEATRAELDAEVDARQKAEIIRLSAPAKVEAGAHIASSCPKIAAAGFTLADEDLDEVYVAISLADPLPDNWQLIRMAMNADANLKTIDGSGVLRVRKDRAEAVLDFIEANIAEE